MVNFQKAVDFKAWQFMITDEDKKSCHWYERDCGKQEQIEAELLNLDVRKMEVIDTTEDRKPTVGTSRFIAFVHQRASSFMGNFEGDSYVLNEGDWLIEDVYDIGGYKVVTDEALKAMILPEW